MGIEIPERRFVDGTDETRLEERLRHAARAVAADRVIDDLEVRHLARVITGCSLLMTDVYSEERIARIMHPGGTLLSGLVGKLIEEQRSAGGEVLYRVRRLPDDVRVVGDMALFDHGLRGLTHVKGYDLVELGARAYKAAGQALRLLAEDRRLLEFFRSNKLLVLPFEQEIGFLEQCSKSFSLYAEMLRWLAHPPAQETVERTAPPRVDLREAVEEAPPLVEAVSGDEHLGTLLTREQLLSAYERMVLFSGLRMDHLRAALRATVVDQDEAIDALCDEFSLFASGTRDLRRPPSYFLVGPTGVGKNHLVESLKRILESTWAVEIPLLTIEGPSYTYPSDINELRGATRGFIRSDESGLLTAFHDRSSNAPLSIILVDEVEKAHPQLRTFFLSILDRGTVTDNRGNLLNFANSMVFFTSNLGYSDAQQGIGPIGYLDETGRRDASDADVRRDLRRALSPEFANRVRTLHFRRLGRASAERILLLEFRKIAERYRDVHGLEIRLEDSAREELLRRGFSPLHGARPLAAVLEQVLNVEISKRIRLDDAGGRSERDAVVSWLRAMRAGERAFDANEVRRRVLETVRAKLGYTALAIRFHEGKFEYVPADETTP